MWMLLAATIDPSQWSYRRQIVLHNNYSTSFSPAPVMIVLDPNWFDYSKLNDSGGHTDLVFTDDDGETVLSFEVKSWNSSGASYVLLEVPDLPAQSSVNIYVYYHGPTSTDYSTDLSSYNYWVKANSALDPGSGDDELHALFVNNVSKRVWLVGKITDTVENDVDSWVLLLDISDGSVVDGKQFDLSDSLGSGGDDFLTKCSFAQLPNLLAACGKVSDGADTNWLISSFQYSSGIQLALGWPQDPGDTGYDEAAGVSFNKAYQIDFVGQWSDGLYRMQDYSGDGTVNWQLSQGSASKTFIPTDLTIDIDNGGKRYVCGYIVPDELSFVDKFDENTSSAPSLLWEITLPRQFIYINSIAVDSNNDYFYVGGHEGSGTDVDVYFAKLDKENGSIIWEKTFDFDKGAGGEDIFDIWIDSDGNLVASGYAKSASQEQFLMLKLDPEGQLLWSYEFYPGGDGRLQACGVDSDNNMVFAGFYDPGDKEGFVIKLFNGQPNIEIGIEESLGVTPPELVSPSNGSMFGMDKTSVLFEWNDCSGFSSPKYELQISTDGEFYSENIVGTYNSTSTDLTVDVSDWNSNYYFWRVRVIDSGTNESSPWSEVWKFALDKRPPALVSACYELLQGKVRLEWEVQDDFSGYNKAKIEIFEDSDFSSKILSAETPDKFYEFTSSSSTYCWRIKLQDIAGNWSEWYRVGEICSANVASTVIRVSEEQKFVLRNLSPEAKVSVYNILGRKVTELSLVNGTAEWNGRDMHGKLCGVGVYFVKVEDESKSKVYKVLVLK